MEKHTYAYTHIKSYTNPQSMSKYASAHTNIFRRPG